MSKERIPEKEKGNTPGGDRHLGGRGSRLGKMSHRRREGRNCGRGEVGKEHRWRESLVSNVTYIK